MAIGPVVDVTDALAEFGFPDAPFAGVGGSDGEFQVEFARAVLGILPERPGPAGQGGQEGAGGGDEIADLGAPPGVAEGGPGFGAEITQQPGQQFGVRAVLHFRKAGQLAGLAADLLLHAFETAGDAKAAGPFERGIEQGKELKRQIIAGGQLLIGGSRRPGTRQPRRKAPLELLRQFPVVKLIFTERRRGVVSGDHATSKPPRDTGGQ